jgi:hypothetical protein
MAFNKSNADHLIALHTINGSIGKWFAIVDDCEKQREVTEDGTTDCPSCRQYLHEHRIVECDRCPIALTSGHTLCGGTPYGAFVNAVRDAKCQVRQSRWHHHLRPTKQHPIPKRVINAAKRELAFLVKVRDKLLAGKIEGYSE